jgi:hypothetical protein
VKILFLDIDGVICSIRSAVACDGFPWTVKEDAIPMFDEVAIKLIRKVCKDTDTKIVLSSVWRLSHDWKMIGEKLNLPIIDKTPHKLSSRRGEEIAMWLRDNKVDKYAIVDDDSDMLEEQLPFFVRVYCKNGLSYENYEQLLKILKKEEKKNEK